MRLLNLGHLSDQLRADALSEKQKLRLVLLMLTLQFLRHGLEFLSYRPRPDFLIVLGIGFLITLIGVQLCFAANSRGDNRNFIERFICLSGVLALWYILIYTLGMMMGAIALQWLTGTRQNWLDAPMIQVFVPSLALIIYYATLRHYFVRIANPVAPQIHTAPIAAL